MKPLELVHELLDGVRGGPGLLHHPLEHQEGVVELLRYLWHVSQLLAICTRRCDELPVKVSLGLHHQRRAGLGMARKRVGQGRVEYRRRMRLIMFTLN